MNQLLSPASSDSDWSQIKPVLDDAMHELSEPDRTAVVLRFFEERSLKDVGIALGLSENAAHMRVDRALEKLRTVLAKRGITSTASGLVAVLATGAVLFAPRGLAAKTVAGTLATTAATSSTVGMLTLMTATKIATILGAAAMLLIVGGTMMKTHRSASIEKSAATADKTARENAPRATHREPKTAGTAAILDESDPDLAAALRKVQDVLDNPRPGRNEPNPAMVAAIAALGDHRRAAVSMLRESLRSADPRVRRQAAEGLGLIGAEAKEAIPDLMEMLRTSDEAALVGLRALKQVGVSTENLPGFAEILSENPAVRRSLAEMVPQLFPTDSGAVDQAFRPLLQSQDLDVRRAAAYTLAFALGNQAGPDVIAVALDALRSSSGTAPDKNVLGDALGILAKAGADPANLGSATGEATTALADIALRSTDKDLQTVALRLLDGLNPEVQKLDPAVAEMLNSYRQTNGFVQRANDGSATLPELVSALQQSPQESSFVASAGALGRLGPAAQSALPVLREALAALELKDGAGANSSETFRIREALVDAIQKIDPQEPKPLFTISDIITVHWIVFDDPALQSDAARRQRISDAVQPIFSSGPSRGIELAPQQMQQLLTTLKNIDQPTYDAVFSQVKKIDPQFGLN